VQAKGFFFTSVVRPHIPRQIATLSTSEKTLDARKGLVANMRLQMPNQV
jgi:hypothetical protein